VTAPEQVADELRDIAATIKSLGMRLDAVARRVSPAHQDVLGSSGLEHINPTTAEIVRRLADEICPAA
jgi:hypothetical protein